MHANFPLMARCLVNGPKSHPVFKHLRKNTPEFQNSSTGKVRNIPWNFAKFIINGNGEILHYVHPRKSLYKMIDHIEISLELREPTVQSQRDSTYNENWI